MLNEVPYDDHIKTLVYLDWFGNVGSNYAKTAFSKLLDLLFQVIYAENIGSYFDDGAVLPIRCVYICQIVIDTPDIQDGFAAAISLGDFGP